jgi:hypothetical protein
MIRLSKTLRKFRRRMMPIVMGTTMRSVRLALCTASNWPDHSSRSPVGSSRRSSIIVRASST